MKKELKVIPCHIGIIMDGNGRWAQRRKLPRIFGYREGLKAVRKVVKAAKKFKIKYLTLYSFSTENWKRPEEEVNFLFKLMETRLRKEGESLNRNNVKVEFTGRKEGLPEKLIEIMDYVRDITKNNTGLNLIFAINYGGRQEILDAVEKIVKKKKIKKVDEGTFRKFLYLPDVLDVDLIIRTAGEKRISNFLIWQSVYSEFYFTDVLWPDFDEEDFYKALVSYQKRKRKFGGLIK